MMDCGFCTGLTTVTATAISVIATLVLIIAVSAVVFTLRKYHVKQRRRQNFYDVAYHYALPPLPPRVQEMDSGIYDTISNESTECETTFSTAVVNDILCNGISFTLEQSNIENGDAPFTVISTNDAEVFQNSVAENDAMQNPPTSDKSAEVLENKIGENRARVADINFESNLVVNESIFGAEALGLQKNQDQKKKLMADESVIQDNTLQEKTMTCDETVHNIQMQENAMYQPSTIANFVLFNNPAYGTDIAIAPEIPAENNIAYQHTCSSQQSSNSDDMNSSSSGLATLQCRSDSLINIPDES